MANPTKWGILGAGLISHDFALSLSLLKNAEDHEIVAVAARSLESAEKFAKEFEIQKAYGSYQQLADDQDIDVIYVGTITPTHLENVTLLLK